MGRPVLASHCTCRRPLLAQSPILARQGCARSSPQLCPSCVVAAPPTSDPAAPLPRQHAANGAWQRISDLPWPPSRLDLLQGDLVPECGGVHQELASRRPPHELWVWEGEGLRETLGPGRDKQGLEEGACQVGGRDWNLSLRPLPRIAANGAASSPEMVLGSGVDPSSHKEAGQPGRVSPSPSRSRFFGRLERSLPARSAERTLSSPAFYSSKGAGSG
nr:uncharacterized protein LOC125621695 [Caretta caretta]